MAFINAGRGVLLAQSNVRLMIDAEHSWFQPAIDHAATELQRRFNTHTPTILNTYQCYLRVSRSGGPAALCWCHITPQSMLTAHHPKCADAWLPVLFRPAVSRLCGRWNVASQSRCGGGPCEAF